MIYVSGKEIAETIKQDLRTRVRSLGQVPKLGIIYIGHDPVIDNFIEYKKRFGKSIGAQVHVCRFDTNVSEKEIQDYVQKNAEKFHGMVLQLPIPEHLNRRALLDAIPVKKDVDVLSRQALDIFETGEGEMYPPVAGAIHEIIKKTSTNLNNKKIVVIGEGLLVGDPVKRFMNREGYSFRIVNAKTDRAERLGLLKEADVIITGVGSPHMIQPEMICEGVIIIDAGTSEAGKKLQGDVDPGCAKKSSIFTPVPGGVGPITIAVLYRNLILGMIETCRISSI